MFLKHFAVGLAAKPVAPRMGLPVLLAAPLALDIVWPVLVPSGIERAHAEKGHLAASPLVLGAHAVLRTASRSITRRGRAIRVRK